MTAETDHPYFPQPPSEDIKLWRYMSFAKFVSLISTNQLYFCRADKFRDPHEGTYTFANNKYRSVIYEAYSPEHASAIMKQLPEFLRRSRQHTFISCWHQNAHESAAMWDLYTQGEFAIAISNKYSALKECLPSRIQLGLISYLDYELDFISENNSFSPFMNKRKSFEHEKEVRAIIQDYEYFEVGQKVSVDLNILIDSIHISPGAESWFKGAVESVCHAFSVSANIISSSLYSQPEI